MGCPLEEHVGVGRQGRIKVTGVLRPQVHARWQNERLHRSVYIWKQHGDAMRNNKKNRSKLENWSELRGSSPRLTFDRKPFINRRSTEKGVSGRCARVPAAIAFRFLLFLKIIRDTRDIRRVEIAKAGRSPRFTPRVFKSRDCDSSLKVRLSDYGAITRVCFHLD